MEELLPAHCGHKKASGNIGRKKPPDDICRQSPLPAGQFRRAGRPVTARVRENHLDVAVPGH
jgi:hypothetical protein